MTMNRNSIRWRLPASYAVIALLAALLLGSLMMLVLRSYYAGEERDYLYRNAITLRPVIEQVLQSDLPEDFIVDQVNGLAFLSQARIRLLNVQGETIADSGIPASNRVVAVSGGAPFDGNVMFSLPVNPPKGDGPVLIYRNDEDLPAQPAIPFDEKFIPGQGADIILSVRASPYGYGFVAKTMSDPSHRSTEIVGVVLTDVTGERLGTLEFSNGPSYGADVIRSVGLAWLVASLFAIAIAALAGWYASQRVTRPVLALEHATREMAHGDLTTRVRLSNERQQEFVSLANSFNEMAERVEEMVGTLRSFVADAAHELHTPLTALQTNLELARDEKDESTRTLYLSRVQEQGQRLETLVKSLLDLSRIETTEVQPDFETINLSDLIREVSEQFASRAEQSNRIFKLDVPDEMLEISGNELQLKQVLANLLDNAIKFTGENDTIVLFIGKLDDEIVIKISDTGIGIPAEDQKNLFERFHRGRNVAEFAGNGLGLAIVKAIVEAHGGKVSAKSDPGAGSEFRVTLPTRL
jgi:two-component system sensor histidine kinase BaeS